MIVELLILAVGAVTVVVLGRIVFSFVVAQQRKEVRTKLQDLGWDEAEINTTLLVPEYFDEVRQAIYEHEAKSDNHNDSKTGI